MGVEVVSQPLDKSLAFYKAQAIGEPKRLTPQEQTFISAFADPKGSHNALRVLAEHGIVLPASLRIDFTFDNGHRGGLLLKKE